MYTRTEKSSAKVERYIETAEQANAAIERARATAIAAVNEFGKVKITLAIDIL